MRSPRPPGLSGGARTPRVGPQTAPEPTMRGMTPPATRSPFDPPLEDMREMGDQVLALVPRFVDGRYDAPSADYTGLAPMLRALAAPPPADGQPLARLLGSITAAAGKG